MIVLGLTGSIGMGKTTVAKMLRGLGVPVHEADAEVHNLLSPQGRAYDAVADAFPRIRYPQIYGRKTKSGDRFFNRKKLGELVFSDARKRALLESILHPLVREAQQHFIRSSKALRTPMIALDIPLLFETGGDRFVDFTINVSAPFEIQRARVLVRPGMTEEKFTAILDSQMPDAEKCRRADFVIRNGLGRAQTLKSLKAILSDIKKDYIDPQ
jgi:dephospho-CoA kinase